MSRWLGAKRRQHLSKDAVQASYVTEVEQVWEHVCKPPMDATSRVLRASPILSDGDQAEVGTRWRCPVCKKVSEVFQPDPDRSPGIREWRLEGGDDTPAERTES